PTAAKKAGRPVWERGRDSVSRKEQKTAPDRVFIPWEGTLFGMDPGSETAGRRQRTRLADMTGSLHASDASCQSAVQQKTQLGFVVPVWNVADSNLTRANPSSWDR